MKLLFDRKFLKLASKIPQNQQRKLAQLLTILERDPFDARLHTKQLSTPLEGIFSFRITREYRVLFRFISEDTIFLMQVRHRKDIYK